MPIEITDNYVRVRVREPKRFVRKSFRTHSLGRGWSKRVAGVLKDSGKWATQTYLVSKHGLLQRDRRTVNLLSSIEQRHGVDLDKVRKIFNITV